MWVLCESSLVSRLLVRFNRGMDVSEAGALFDVTLDVRHLNHTKADEQFRGMRGLWKHVSWNMLWHNAELRNSSSFKFLQRTFNKFKATTMLNLEGLLTQFPSQISLSTARKRHKNQFFTFMSQAPNPINVKREFSTVTASGCDDERS